MIDVTAAIWIENGRVLIARRRPGVPRAGLWEFPGGKVQAGESPRQCLTREIREELGIEIDVGAFFGESVYAYADQAIRLLAYRVQRIAGRLAAHDHAELTWAAIEELAQYPFAPADLPFVKMLQENCQLPGEQPPPAYFAQAPDRPKPAKRQSGKGAGG